MLLQSREIRITWRVCVCVWQGDCSVCVTWESTTWGGSLVQLLALPLTECSSRQLSNGRRRAVVIVVFVLCALMENVFYKAWGSRLVGSRELLHKVILLLSNLMWCTVNLSSQVALSHLRFLLVWFVWEVSLCSVAHAREGMLNEVSHSGPCVVH